MNLSEQCDRCRQTYTQVVEDGQVVKSQPRPYDDLCSVVEPQVPPDVPLTVEQITAMIERRARLPGPPAPLVTLPAHMPAPRKIKVCRACIDDYREKHAEFVRAWPGSGTEADQPKCERRFGDGVVQATCDVIRHAQP